MTDAEREIAEQVRAMIPRLVDKRISTIRENLISEVLRRIDFESLSDDVLEMTSKRISVFGGSSVIPRINADTVDFLAPNAGNTVQNLAGSAGASLVGFLPSGIGAVARTLQAKGRDTVSVEDYGGSPTASAATNDTAFTNALATGKLVRISTIGTWKYNQIKIPSSGSGFIGDSETGIVLQPTGTQAKSIITDNQVSHTFFNYNIFQNFTLDLVNLPNAATSFGIYLAYSFGNLFSNIRDINTGGSAFALGSGTGVYTSTFIDTELVSISFAGASGADRVTTLTFIGHSGQFAKFQNAANITFIQPTMQSNYPSKFDITQVDGLTLIGGDNEGSGNYIQSNGPNNTNIAYFNPQFYGTVVSGISGTAPVNTWDLNGLKGTSVLAAVPQTSGTITLDQATITWEIIGKRLFFSGQLHVSAVSAPVGELQFTGLPYLPKAGQSGAAGVALAADGLAAGATTQIVTYIQGGQSVIFARQFAAGNNGALAGNVQAGSTFWLSGNYPLT